MKPRKTWIVIADGARARVVLNEGPGKGVQALDDLIFEGDHAPVREVMADRPGRTFDRAGEGRHAMEYASDPHQNLKARFAGQLAKVLAQRVGDYDRIILVAPPTALAAAGLPTAKARSA